MLIKILFLFVVWAYIYFIPVSTILTITYFVIQVNSYIFLESYIIKFLYPIFPLYILLILQFHFFKKKKFKKLNIIIYTLFLILTLLLILLFDGISKYLKDFSLSFVFIIISYIDIYNLKFNNFKQTLKNLTINFYGFLITSIILFGLKIYLLMQNIKNPSFYYLFLTIPISLLIIYFYIKDLQPVIKSLKEISNDSDKNMENLI